MQTVLTYLTLFLTSMILHAQNSIQVKLTGFESDEGMVIVGLFDSEDSFLEKPQKSISAKIKEFQSEVVFTEIPDGTYAISCFHDVDNNGELNKFMGLIPREPYGTSNNAPSKFGPPKWDDASFQLMNGEIATFEIVLNR